MLGLEGLWYLLQARYLLPHKLAGGGNSCGPVTPSSAKASRALASEWELAGRGRAHPRGQGKGAISGAPSQGGALALGWRWRGDGASPRIPGCAGVEWKPLPHGARFHRINLFCPRKVSEKRENDCSRKTRN